MPAPHARLTAEAQRANSFAPPNQRIHCVRPGDDLDEYSSEDLPFSPTMEKTWPLATKRAKLLAQIDASLFKKPFIPPPKNPNVKRCPGYDPYGNPLPSTSGVNKSTSIWPPTTLPYDGYGQCIPSISGVDKSTKYSYSKKPISSTNKSTKYSYSKPFSSKSKVKKPTKPISFSSSGLSKPFNRTISRARRYLRQIQKLQARIQNSSKFDETAFYLSRVEETLWDVLEGEGEIDDVPFPVGR